MTDAPDWSGMEEELAGLLPGAGPSPDRPRLLGALASYASAAVREARRQGALAPTPAERARALPWLERPVFVCGHHRSGTTLMQELLDGHPELAVLPNEGTYLTSFAYAARADVPPDDADRFAADWIRRFVDPNFEPHFRLGRSAAGDSPSVRFARRLYGWQEALGETWPARAPFALLLALAAAFADVASPASAPRLWVEKTPRNELHALRLAAAFPRARFIQLVREPMATLASVMEAYRSRDGNPVSAFRHALAIGRSLRLAGQNRRRLPARYLVVRYEDLSRAPAREMEGVRALLAISPSPSLATPTVLGRPVRSNSSFERGEAGVVVPPRSPPALPADAAELVRAFAAAPARALGYELEPLPPARRAALLLRELPRYALDRIRARW